MQRLPIDRGPGEKGDIPSTADRAVAVLTVPRVFLIPVAVQCSRIVPAITSGRERVESTSVHRETPPPADRETRG